MYTDVHIFCTQMYIWDEICLVPTERVVFSSVWWCSIAVALVCGRVEDGAGCLVWQVCGATPLVRGVGGRGGAGREGSDLILYPALTLLTFYPRY